MSIGWQFRLKTQPILDKHVCNIQLNNGIQNIHFSKQSKQSDNVDSSAGKGCQQISQTNQNAQRLSNWMTRTAHMIRTSKYKYDIFNSQKALYYNKMR